MESPRPPPLHEIASIDVEADPFVILDDWRALAELVPITPYSTPEWVMPWFDAIGRPSGIAPMFVVARDTDRRPMALLPMGISRPGMPTVASFLGGRDSNFNMGLFRPGPVWTRPALLDLLRRAATMSDRRIDLFALRNQPHSWDGVANPMAALAHQASPSFAYKASLTSDPETFLRQHVSRQGRKKLRQKMNRLRGLGPVAVVEARTPSEISEVLDAFTAQRMARNTALGLPSEDLPGLRRFLDLAVGDGGPVRFHALRCGDRIVATLGGARRGTRFSGMLTSFTTTGEFARTSPGELLLSEVMKSDCLAGLATFDLGIGEARYKGTYCPDVEPLFDSLVPVTSLGHVCAWAEASRLRLKRVVKQSRWAWPLVQRLRRTRRELMDGPADEEGL